jgi:hypothetical protein
MWGINLLDSLASNTKEYPSRDTCDSSPKLIDLLGVRESRSTLKNPRCKKYSFHKLTQSSQGKSVLDATASNTSGFLSRELSV